MTWTLPTVQKDGTTFADHKPSKGQLEKIRVFYEQTSAKHAAESARRRRGVSARTFTRTVKADGAELVVYVVVTRHPLPKTEA